MKVAICVVGRLENRYAVEFVEYYKNLGIDHIYIGDNNYDGEEHFEYVIQQHIDNNYVTIINLRNIPNSQGLCYLTAYNNYHSNYDYMIFIDFDEYICLTKDSNIKEYLARNIKKYNIIKLNWMLYTDNDLVIDDGRPLNERFTTPMDYNKKVSFDHIPENFHVKCIISCEFNSIQYGNPHIPLDTSYSINENNYKICNNEFKDANNCWYEHENDNSINYNLAYIKHFFTKTIDEYINNKKHRGTIEGGVKDFNKRYLGRFFKINNLTPEKEKYCLEHNIDSKIL